MEREVKYMGNWEYKAFMKSVPGGQRFGHEFEEGHPAAGYPNLIHPETGVVMVLNPDMVEPDM